MNEFIFVHLGKSIPKYLELNLKRTHNLFPNSRITLICDNSDFRSNFANISLYKQSESTKEVFSKSHLDGNFRSGFWVKSLERLIAVFEYQIRNQVQKLIHIESDVLLMPNFPLDALGDLAIPTWTKYSDAKSVGAIVCIPTHRHAEQLLQSTLSLIARNTKITDMTLLHELSESVKVAETFSHDVLYSNTPLHNSKEKTKRIDLREGFFDPAQIGMWLTGEDPRNHLGMYVIHSNELFELGDSKINPAELLYSIDSEHNLWAKNPSGTEFPIWSLHIHSKNKKLFREKDSSELIKFIQKSRDLNIERSLNVWILCRLILENLKNRTLMAYTKSALRYLLSISDKHSYFLPVMRKRNENI